MYKKGIYITPDDSRIEAIDRINFIANQYKYRFNIAITQDEERRIKKDYFDYFGYPTEQVYKKFNLEAKQW